jgi:hypothetical protein
MGMYRVNGNGLGFAVNGSTVLTMDISANIYTGGRIQTGNGSVSLVNYGHVSAANTGLYLTSTSAGISVAGTSAIQIDSLRNVGIGTSTPLDKLQVFGDIRLGTTGTNGCIKNYAGTGLVGTCSSDERLKTNIVDFQDGYLDKLVNLKVVTYNWNDTAKDINFVDTTVTNYGLLAQNAEDSFPELVTTDSNGYKQVDYSRLPLYILKAVQELAVKVSGIFDGTMSLFVNDLRIKNNLCVDDICITKD